ncbi:adenylate/guanylate cyclase [Candidatus Moduliflexus flocculans]|uniref:Adenylate/guanylate cyclase n=1 Tax=Candidatus Moduliflexus flocculans TaxID=1499966 RepID=A0A0S6VRJ3_9BACT|nr:adenylate/guanylate cyclase [Candidatus Moduliflexus flocculans]
MFAMLTHPRIRMFLMISALLGVALCIVHADGVFTPFDLLILSGQATASGGRVALWLALPIILAWALFPGLVILRYGNEIGLFASLGGGVAYLLVALAAARSGLMLQLPLIAPLIAALAAIIRVMGWGAAFLEREKERVNKLFGYFLDNEVLKYLLQHPDLINKTGNTKQLTILFADIRGFTAQSETLPPDVIIMMLREYFRQIIPVIRKHGGTVDKLMGDGIMAFFGDPIPQPDHACRAALTALEMQATMQRVAKDWERHGINDVGIGIGLNSDNVVVGNIGSDEFCDYTVLGRGVNLASRLESKCPAGQIHVSAAVYQALSTQFVFEPLGEFAYKNIQGKVPVYRLISKK